MNKDKEKEKEKEREKIEDLIRQVLESQAEDRRLRAADDARRDAAIEKLSTIVHNLSDTEVKIKMETTGVSNSSASNAISNNNNNNVGPQVLPQVTPVLHPSNPNNNNDPTNFIVTGDKDTDLQDALIGKGKSSFVGDKAVLKPTGKKGIPTGAHVVDFTMDDSDEEEVGDPTEAATVANIFKGISSKLKKNKKSTLAKKKLKIAASYGEWTRRLVRFLLRNPNATTLNRYAQLIERVGWLNKHQGWNVARTYGNLWIKLDRERQLHEPNLPLLDPSVIDPAIHTKATAKAGRLQKDKEKLSSSSSSSTNNNNNNNSNSYSNNNNNSSSSRPISASVYARFPCNNCGQTGHWSSRCPHPCKFCKASHDCKSCPKNPDKPSGSGGGPGSSGGASSTNKN
jgi:hypothetical protein